jgi:hypothetical protein
MSGQLNVQNALPPGHNPGSHWTEGWVGPRAGMDGFGEKKTSCPYRTGIRTPASSP